MIREGKDIGIPSGKLLVNTRRGFGEQLRSGQVPSLQEFNSNKILFEDAFFIEKIGNPEDPSLPPWGISAKLPTSQYSEPSVMTVASPIFEETEKSSRTLLIYDAPETVQEKYWEMTLRLLNSISEYSRQKQHPLHDSTVFLTGHHCRQRQYTEFPSARSVLAHHDHIMIIPKKLPGKTYHAQDFGLPDETQLLISQTYQNNPFFLKNFVFSINDTFPLDLSIREQKPVGYSFRVKNDPAALTTTLSKHFKSYKTAMESSEYLERVVLGRNFSKDFLSRKIAYDSKKGKVVQPSFVLYLIPDNDYLTTIISPMLVGIGGPERAGIKLEKGPDKPKRFNPSEYEKIILDIKRII